MSSRRRVVYLVMCAVLLFASIGSAQQPTSQLYDPSPDHLWNAIHASLFVRTAADGKQYGHDTVDPLLWGQSKYLFEPKNLQRSSQLLDQFLSQDGETLIGDPLKRAVFQHDLWAMFDFLATGEKQEDAGRQQLETRLAKVIKRLALSPEQIAKLPDTYAAAVSSKEFPAAFDSAHADAAFLPADLLAKNSPWTAIGTATTPAGPTYTLQHGGRSSFTIFMRTPAGRSEARSYLQRLGAYSTPYVRINSTNADGSPMTQIVINPNLPALPTGSQFVALRQMVLIDSSGTARATGITEEVRIRVNGGIQQFFDFTMRRDKLFKNQSGGLRAYAKDDQDFIPAPTGATAIDPLETAQPQMQNVLQSCTTCHQGNGLSSFLSFNRPYSPTEPKPPVLTDRSDWDTMGRWTVTSATYDSPSWLTLKRLWIEEK